MLSYIQKMKYTGSLNNAKKAMLNNEMNKLTNEFTMLVDLYAEEKMIDDNFLNTKLHAEIIHNLINMFIVMDEESNLINYEDIDFFAMDNELKNKGQTVKNREALVHCAENGIADFFLAFRNEKNNLDFLNYERMQGADVDSLSVRAMMRGHANTSNIILKLLPSDICVTSLNVSAKNNIGNYLKGLNKNDEHHAAKSIGVLATAIIYSENDDFLNYYIDNISKIGSHDKDEYVNRIIANENISTAVALVLTSIKAPSLRKKEFLKRAIESGWEIPEEQQASLYKAFVSSSNLSAKKNESEKKCEIEILEIALDMNIDFSSRELLAIMPDITNNGDHKECELINSFSYACWNKNNLFIQFMLKNSSSVEDINFGSFNDNPLHWLLVSGKISDDERGDKTVKMSCELIDYGMSAIQKNDDGKTPVDLLEFRRREPRLSSMQKTINLYYLARNAIIENLPDEEKICIVNQIEEYSSSLESFEELNRISSELKANILNIKKTEPSYSIPLMRI